MSVNSRTNQENAYASPQIIVKEYNYTDLSQNYDINLIYKMIPTNDNNKNDSSIILVKILDKKTHSIVDSIFYTSIYLMNPIFMDSNRVRSYFTNKNTKQMVIDNDYGDLIIADFNFDSKEDIAIVNDYGGNGGLCYNFYIQQADRKFRLNSFLTNEMQRFPSTFNKKRHTLTTKVHASAYSMKKTIYKLSKRNKWKIIHIKLLQ